MTSTTESPLVRLKAALSPETQALGAVAQLHLAGHTVVAIVIEWRGKIALLKRSQGPSHDRGRWHCVTGYVDEGVSPGTQALLELSEETGLQATDLTELREGPVLMLSDDSGAPWFVHTFTAVTSQRRLILDWEHEAFRWTAPHKAARFANRVSWLDAVLAATGHLNPR